IIKATTDDINSDWIILIKTLYFNELKPAAAIAAPAIEPINACEELLGIPKYHVIKFHAIAANSAAKITADPFSKANGSTISFVIVFATPVKVIAPAKFITDAKIIARLGVSALVETDGAIAFAVSWKPLIKSKITARATIKMVMSKIVFILLSTP